MITIADYAPRPVFALARSVHSLFGRSSGRWAATLAVTDRLLPASLDKLWGGAHNQATWGNLQIPAYRKWFMSSHLVQLCANDEGQDIAEYAVMLAVILVIVVGTIRLVGSHANNVFSTVASSIQ
jgi:Flp pilus assembly pilin Flp